MADNQALGAGGSDFIAAADEATYSGDTTKIQIIRLVHVTGSEGAKSVAELIRLADAAFTAGDPGLPILGVRNDAAAARSGTDGDYTPISVTPEGHVDVEARRDLVMFDIAVSGVTTATTAYTAGDQVGSQITLTGAARISGGTGTIVGAVLIDRSDIISAYDIVFHDSSITPASDNAAYAISDADALKTVGMVQLTGGYDIGNNRIAQAYNIAMPFKCSGSANLYCTLITRFGHTFFTSGSEPYLRVYVERN